MLRPVKQGSGQLPGIVCFQVVADIIKNRSLPFSKHNNSIKEGWSDENGTFKTHFFCYTGE